MIDIHHHLLFGTDDGPRDLEAAVAQAQAAAADGITHIVCTPHANEVWTFDPVSNQETLQALRERVPANLTLGLGCDFHLSWDNIQEAIASPSKFTINHGSYLLVEFAEHAIPVNIGSVFHDFALHGIRTIITHPERSPVLRRNPQRLETWLRGQCLVQITAGSLAGNFGSAAQSFAWELLRRNWVHFIATDAHNLDSRPPALRFAWQAVAKKFGEATAERLCVLNPRAAFENTALPEQPPPQDSSGSGEPGWIARLFGR
jgi:protein-tyrosine phosphatase